MQRQVLVEIALAALLAALPTASFAAAKSFNVASGDWSVDGNWNPPGAPTAADDVTIPAARTVTLNSPGATVASLTQSGNLQGDGVLTVTGVVTWSGGQMAGSGVTNANGGAHLNGAAVVTLADTRTLNCSGSSTWTGNTISMATTAVLNNLGGASFDIQTSADALGGTFNNAGVLTKSSGSATRFSGLFNNTGTLTVAAGAVELDGGGTHGGGDFVAADGATLQFGGGTHALTMGATVGGAGTIEFAGGTTNLSGVTYDPTGATRVAGGTANFTAGATVTSIGALSIASGALNLSSGEAIGTAVYTQTGGILDGTDDLAVSGLLTWNGGTMTGSGTTHANGGMEISNGAVVGLQGTRTLENAGVATWTGTSFSNNPGGVLRNLAGGMFNIETSADFLNGTFNNAGALVKTLGSGDGITRFSGALNNTGSVTVSSGSLELDGGGTHGAATFSVATSATLQFGGGAHSVTGASSIGGAGTVDFAGSNTDLNGGTYDVTGATTVHSGTVTFGSGVLLTSLGTLAISGGTLNLSSGELAGTSTYTQSGGTLAGSDALSVSGLVTWSGGSMAGTGVLNANGGLLMNNAAAIGLTGSRTLNNAGAATWTGNSLVNSATGVFNNLGGATLDVQTSGDFLSGTFNNAGTMNKIAGGAGDGITQFTGAYNNAGTINANAGVLQFNGAFNQSAGLTRLGGGALSTNTGIHINGGRLDGNGTITGNVTNSGGVVAPGLSPGALDLVGAFTQAQDGTFSVELGGTDPAQYDRLASTQVASLGGTLDVSLADDFVPKLGDSFQIMTFGSHTGDFAAANGLLLGGGRGLRETFNAADLTLLVVEEICDDLIDNDADGFIDCDDVKCSVVPICMGTPTPTRTRTPTVTPTPTITATATRSGTPTPTLTATRSPTTTGSATPTVPCTGDCHGAGLVSEQDVETALHAMFDPALIDECTTLDADGDGRVVAAELLEAIRSRATSCAPRTMPPTVTRTPTPVDSTPGIPPLVSGGVTLLANAMGVIPNIVTAIASGINLGSGADLEPLLDAGGAAGACPLGGNATRSGSFPFVSIGLSNCKVATADGSATFNGSASINFTSFSVNIGVIFADMNGDETRRSGAVLNGSVSPSLGGSCVFTAATLTVISGTLSTAAVAGPQIGATFQNTQIRIDQLAFDNSCVPITYRLTFNGNAALLTPQGDAEAVVFTQMTMSVDDHGDPTLLSLEGGMTSSCFGGAVTLATPSSLAVPADQICPVAGLITATSAQGGLSIQYNADGSVTIDGLQTFPNCLDPRLIMCAA